jgi:hypothetical protein
MARELPAKMTAAPAKASARVEGEIGGRSLREVLEMRVDPARRPCLAERLGQERPVGVQLAGDAEARHGASRIERVDEQALEAAVGDLALIDQSGDEFDRPRFADQRGIEGNFVAAIEDLGRSVEVDGIELVASMPTRPSSSMRSSTPQAKVPCAPPPCKARLTSCSRRAPPAPSPIEGAACLPTRREPSAGDHRRGFPARPCSPPPGLHKRQSGAAPLSFLAAGQIAYPRPPPIADKGKSTRRARRS